MQIDGPEMKCTAQNMDCKMNEPHINEIMSMKTKTMINPRHDHQCKFAIQFAFRTKFQSSNDIIKHIRTTFSNLATSLQFNHIETLNTINFDIQLETFFNFLRQNDLSKQAPKQTPTNSCYSSSNLQPRSCYNANPTSFIDT